MPGFDNNVVYAGNVDFSGADNVTPQVTADGQLLIGSTVSPNIKVGTLTAGNGIEITNGSGSITISSSQVLQEVRSNISSMITCDGEIPWDDTIPQNTEGTEVLTCTITPKYSDSILKIEFFGTGATQFSSVPGYTVALFQDIKADAVAAANFGWNPSGLYSTTISLVHFQNSDTISPTTFKVRIGGDNATRPIYINGGGGVGLGRKYGGVSSTYLIITEIRK